MKCPRCGKECDETVKFCSNCAYPISVYMEGLKHNKEEREKSYTQQSENHHVPTYGNQKPFEKSENHHVPTYGNQNPFEKPKNYTYNQMNMQQPQKSSSGVVVIVCVCVVAALLLVYGITNNMSSYVNNQSKDSGYQASKDETVSDIAFEDQVELTDEDKDLSKAEETKTEKEDIEENSDGALKDDIEESKDEESKDEEISKGHTIVDKPSDDEIINVDRYELHKNAHKYEDKWVRIAGKITAINGEENEKSINFYGQSGIKLIMCELMSDQSVDGLSEDDYVIVVGKVETKLIGQLMIYHCYIDGVGDAAKAFSDEINSSEAIADESANDDGESTEKKTSLFGTAEIDKSTAIQLTAKGIYKEMEANQVACKTKYDGKVVAITGTIEDIGSNIYGQEYVTLDVGDPYTLGGVQCFFKNDQMDYVATLSKGQSVTLYGYADVGSMTFKLGNSQP